ncbi:hypothetical protein, partial [Oryzibacter oryziterrae]|uniref:hypothetical protein n=1 Tax=Oryzibacter oryziterrae TaxID=2766474 RepID=UPI001F250834
SDQAHLKFAAISLRMMTINIATRFYPDTITNPQNTSANYPHAGPLEGKHHPQPVVQKTRNS